MCRLGSQACILLTALTVGKRTPPGGKGAEQQAIDSIRWVWVTLGCVYMYFIMQWENLCRVVTKQHVKDVIIWWKTDDTDQLPESQETDLQRRIKRGKRRLRMEGSDVLRLGANCSSGRLVSPNDHVLDFEPLGRGGERGGGGGLEASAAENTFQSLSRSLPAECCCTQKSLRMLTSLSSLW